MDCKTADSNLVGFWANGWLSVQWVGRTWTRATTNEASQIEQTDEEKELHEPNRQRKLQAKLEEFLQGRRPDMPVFKPLA